MTRAFNGSTDQIVTALGACGFAFGPGTCAVVCRHLASNSGVYSGLVGAGAGLNWEFGILPTDATAPDELTFWNGSVSSDSPLKLSAADGWAILACSKATGTVAPRMHRYLFSTNTWTHDATGIAVANPTAPATSMFIGSGGSFGDNMKGDISLAAVWNVVLTDAQIESLAGAVNAWFAVQPKALWIVDQAATAQKVVDLTGGGANQSALSGTAIGTVSVPGPAYA